MVRTASGARAIQLIRYERATRVVVKHVGSAHTDEELAVLQREAQILRKQLCQQPSLEFEQEPSRLLHRDHLHLSAVTHQLAYDALRCCSQHCGLGSLPSLYQDLALMRIIEPTSKLRTLKLLHRYFNIAYAPRTVYRRLPRLLTYQNIIESAAYQTACTHFSESFALILYDVTTLYFESHEPDDELRARGFSKENKPQQPQIVLGLLVTSEGFPLQHEVYQGNTFEGHTMLSVVTKFQQRHRGGVKPIVVADAAMLSQKNLQLLDQQGYHYIVGARLANAPRELIHTITATLARQPGATIRIPYPERTYDMICSYSPSREKKDRREFEKHLARAHALVARQEPGKRAKFVKKSTGTQVLLVLDDELKEKTEKLLGIKGYCTNLPKDKLCDEQIIAYYHDLWHVEQTFRMSKTDLKARPIFHWTQQAIQAHILLCFMALMMGKFLEIKTGLSLQRIRDILWNVHEVHIEDKLTGQQVTLRTNLSEYQQSGLDNLLKPH